MSVLQESFSTRVLNHLVVQIAAAPVEEKPYSHFYLERAFPDDVFKQMLEYMPPPGAYGGDNPRIHTREDGLITRNIISVLPPALAQLDEPLRSFWREIGEALTSRRLKDVVFARLAKDLTRRFGVSAEGLKSITAYPKPALVKDLGGYGIKPHTDTNSKIVTMQFYLPHDHSKLDLGTAVYRFQLSKLLYAPSKRFEKVKQFAFGPNSGYAFAVGRKSWHGRETVPMASGERNSLMLIYYAVPGKGW